MTRPIVALLALAAVAGPVNAQTVVVGVGGELSGLKNEEIRVPLFADMSGAGGEMLGSYTVRITWNPAILSFNGGEPGAFAEPVGNADSAGYGVLWVAGISAAGGSGLLDLAALHFWVDSADTSPIAVEVTELSAAGTLTDLTAGATVVNGTFCPALGRWGDVSGDRAANSLDALVILSHTVGIEMDSLFDVSMGDVDGDGLVNTRDALIILSYGVGLEIPGQRVLLVAGGACATQVTPTVVLVPDSLDLVVGQMVMALVRGTNQSGANVTLQGVNWEVGDPDVAMVNMYGEVEGVSPGVTTLTAGLGPGVTLSVPLVVRSRRVHWYVDAPTAVRAPVQMGTAAWPFATPEYAFPLLREGDTVHVRPGIHDYVGYYYYAPAASPPADAPAVYYPTGPLIVGAVIVGDTLADGTRPVLRAPVYDYRTAFPWYGGQHGEIRNLVFRGFDEVVTGEGIRNLVVENVRIEEPSLNWAEGLVFWTPIDTLIVRNSEFISDTAYNSGYAIDVDWGASLVTVQDSRFENWGYAGIYGWNVDSVDVRRSEFLDIDGYGVYVEVGGGGGEGAGLVDGFGAPRASGSALPSVAVTLVQNRFVDNYYESVEVHGARSVTMEGNYIREPYWNATYLRGPGSTFADAAGSVFRSTNDSIVFVADDWDWIYAFQFDSILIDRLWLNVVSDSVGYQWGYVEGNYIRLTNSQLLNLVEGDGFIAYARDLVVDNTDFIGCPTCDWLDANALEAWNYYGAGPKVTVTNSTFQTVQYAFYHNQTGYGAGPMTFSGNTVDSVSYGLYYNADTSLVENNTFTRIRNIGVRTTQTYTTSQPVRRAVMRNNDVSCSVQPSYTAYGLYATYMSATFDDNVIRNCDYGIYAYNSPSTAYPLADIHIRGDSLLQAADSSGQYGAYVYGRYGYGEVSRNTVRRGLYGLYLGPDYVTGDTSAFLVDSNAVSQTLNYGVYLPGYDAITFTGRWNNISNNALDGLYSTGTGTRSFTLGRFVGNKRWAVGLGSGAVNATQNWWGSTNGAGGVYGSGLADADSVASPNITVTSPLTADTAHVPSLGPPAGLVASAPGGVQAAPQPEPPEVVEAQGSAVAEERAAHQERREARRAALEAERQAKLQAMQQAREQRRQARGGGSN